MIGSHVKAIASGVALLSTLSFAWSISGTVVTEAGEGIPQVSISSFNYPGTETQSDALGNFTLSNDGGMALSQNLSRQLSVHYTGKVLTMEGLSAQTLKIAVMDALGKVVYNKEFREVYGSLNIDLNKVAGQRTSFLRITSNGSNATYMLTAKGALLKEGDALASFMFVKAGFETTNYQMKAEVETGIKIVMKAAGATPSSASSSSVATSSEGNSSSVNPTSSTSSSSVEPPPSSSSEKPADTPIDCSSKTMKSKTTITVDGRKVDVHFPNGYKGDTPVPLLVYYHPIMGNSGNADGSSTVKAALADGAIVAAPNGETGGMGQAWNVGPCCTTADDVTFSRHFIDEIKEKACVDPKRIYAAGFSMGGGFSNYAGCEMADVFAAAAPSAFDLAKEIVDAGKCKPARPYPILNFRGTSDNIVMYDGGLSQVVPGMPITFMGAKNNLKEWAKMNGCKGEPKQGVPGNDCEMYEECDGGAKVGLCTIKGGQHAEGDGKMGWDFVKQFSL
jgi:polyhydroxybutyrate depolymerase